MSTHRVKTKIICTIGPSVNSLEKMMSLIDAGMDVARLNFSHGTHEEHLHSIKLLKEAREKRRSPLAIMLDTKGPEIRLGKLKEGQISLLAGQNWKLSNSEFEGDEYKVSVFPGSVLAHLDVGARILFDDGYIGSTVIEKLDDGVIVQILNSGSIRSGKGINVPNTSLNLPSLTEKDIADIQFGCDHDIDIIAASFVRSAEHLLAIKQVLRESKKPNILVIAKIENHEGVHYFESILRASDGIMIARGDLGVEVPLSHVPRLQKMMIRQCYLSGKPVVTATQMLESMIFNPRPTRAETSDVANAIYDSTSAVMLSGETAIGKYPVETVNMMHNIIEAAEVDFNYRTFFDQHSPLICPDLPSAVTLATINTAYSCNAKAVFALTQEGMTARLLSRLRPKMPIIALTTLKSVYHQLALNWGVVPFYAPICESVVEGFNLLSVFALENQLVENGDLVVVTAGTPFGTSGTTNMMIVARVGDVLAKGPPSF